ncbi:MAG: hypothetical protein PSY12_02815 [bacterium]|nr:hypothetical protein [bacterium]
MKGVSWLSALAALCVPPLIAPSAAIAQPTIRIDTRMFVERVRTDVNGRARRILASADRAGPGDQLIFVMDWRNAGRRPVRGFALTTPVPRGASPDLTDPAMWVSVDGGAHWGRLDQLWLPTPLGGTRRATAEDVTHVRWMLADAISPGQAGRLSYRAMVR